MEEKTKINIIPNFSSQNEIYYINNWNKISKGRIVGFMAETIVVDENNNILKIGQGKYQIQKFRPSILDMVDVDKVFESLEKALKYVCYENDIFLELEKTFQPKQVKMHKEEQFNPIGTFDEYQSIAMSTKAYGKGLPVFYPTIKLNGEAGEVAEKVGKAWRDKEGNFDPEYKKEIQKELGDTLWYIAAIADDLGFNLVDVANTNIKKILDRRNRGVVSGEGDNR